MQACLTPTRLELRGWGDWTDVRGSAIDMDEVGSLVASLKARLTVDFQECFDGQPLNRSTGIFLPKELADRSLAVRSHVVRIIAEIAPDRRPVSKAQASSLGTMTKFGLERDVFDIKWLTNSSRPAGQRATLVQKPTHSQGSKWWTDETVRG